MNTATDQATAAASFILNHKQRAAIIDIINAHIAESNSYKLPAVTAKQFEIFRAGGCIGLDLAAYMRTEIELIIQKGKTAARRTIEYYADDYNKIELLNDNSSYDIRLTQEHLATGQKNSVMFHCNTKKKQSKKLRKILFCLDLNFLA